VSGKQKSRELRRRVMLPARIRTSAGWGDACILNISSRGMMIHSNRPAPKDGQVELRHAEHVIAGRVIWQNGPRLGLAVEERLRSRTS
jgi:hypothetical protein